MRPVAWNRLMRIYKPLDLDLDHRQFAHDQEFHKSFYQYIESVNVVKTLDMRGNIQNISEYSWELNLDTLIWRQ